VINPNGARADLLIAANDDTNSDWNGVWDAATIVNSDGWFAEVEIPYNTLKFKNAPKQIWAVNLNVTSARIMSRPGGKTGRGNNSRKTFRLPEPCPVYKYYLLATI